MTFTEYHIDVKRPARFSGQVEQLGKASLVRQGHGFKKHDGLFFLRIYGDPDFIVFTIENNSLCKSIVIIT